MIRGAVLIVMLAVPVFGKMNYKQGECGRFLPNATPVPSAITGAPVSAGQWPWHVAIFIDWGKQYRCSGTLVSRRHIITAARSVTQRGTRNIIDKTQMTIYFGKYNISNPHDGTPTIFLKKITIHPEYNETNIYVNNLAIIELWNDINWDWVIPACLWPEELTDFSNIINRSGSVIGWGYDYVLGRSNAEMLTQMDLSIVDQQTCIDSAKKFYMPRTSNSTYCAGNRDGATIRNINLGESMVFNDAGTWYLRGIASTCVGIPDTNSCDPNYYVIFTDIAKHLPWIRENMNNF